jgi:hypothetical protein
MDSPISAEQCYKMMNAAIPKGYKVWDDRTKAAWIADGQVVEGTCEEQANQTTGPCAVLLPLPTGTDKTKEDGMVSKRLKITI